MLIGLGMTVTLEANIDEARGWLDISNNVVYDELDPGELPDEEVASAGCSEYNFASEGWSDKDASELVGDCNSWGEAVLVVVGPLTTGVWVMVMVMVVVQPHTSFVVRDEGE